MHIGDMQLIISQEYVNLPDWNTKLVIALWSCYDLMSYSNSACPLFTASYPTESPQRCRPTLPLRRLLRLWETATTGKFSTNFPGIPLIAQMVRTKCVITCWKWKWTSVFLSIDCCLYTRPRDKGPRDMSFWDDSFINCNYLMTS